MERSKLIPFSTIYGAGALHERHFDIAGPPGSPAPMSFTNPTPSDGSGAQFFHIRSLTNVRDNGRQAVMDLLNLNASLTSLNGSLTQFADVGLDVNRVMVVGVSYGGMVATVFVTVNQLAIAREALVGLTSQLAPVKGVVASGAGSQLWPMLVSSPTYGPVLEGALAAAGHAPGASKYERFLYAGQSAMDAADPVSFAGVLASLGVPILAQQIND